MPDVDVELADSLRRTRASGNALAAGLAPDSRIRRVPGLEREEVALLAGVSTDHHTRLEQGRRTTPSPAVVDAVARARSAPVVQRLRHPVVGPLTVDDETFTAPGDVDQAVIICSTPPGSPSRQAMDLLASWSHPAGALQAW